MVVANTVMTKEKTLQELLLGKMMQELLSN